MKDWSGNSRSCHAMLGARNYALNEREAHDFYATEPKALELLLEKEDFNKKIWEPACGEGHLSKVLLDRGYDVLSTDLIQRSFGKGGVDFLTTQGKIDRDIITNPPYRHALEFIVHALNVTNKGSKIAMFLKLQFLEGKRRREFFDKFPPEKIYVSSSRLRCAMNGDFLKYSKSNAVCYAWFIWTNGYYGEPILRWFN